jgi:hypothetical protein
VRPHLAVSPYRALQEKGGGFLDCRRDKARSYVIVAASLVAICSAVAFRGLSTAYVLILSAADLPSRFALLARSNFVVF